MKKTSHKRKVSRSYSGLLIAIISVVTAFALVSYSQKSKIAPPQIAQIGVDQGVVELTLSPASSTIEPDSDQLVTLTANAGSRKLTGVQVEITYDASKLGTPTVTQGDFLTQAIIAATTTGGKIKFVYGSALDSGGVSGSGTVATIKFHPTVVGSSTLTFTENTEAYVTGNDTNLLKSANNAVITVANAQASSEPSSNPSSEPSSRPSSNPSSQPSSTPSPSPSPSSSSLSVPSKTTTLRGTTVTCSSLSYSWDKISGAKGYLIELADNTNFDNHQTSNNLGSDKDSYTFNNLKNGTKYYARVTQTDISDYPRFTTLGPISTLSACVGAPVTTPTPTPANKTVVKASPKPSPKASTVAKASPSPSSTLAPAAFTDKRLDNWDAGTQTQDQSADTGKKDSLLARFVAWIFSIFQKSN